MVDYNLEDLIYQAEEDYDEDCELPEELVRLLQQESKLTQLYQEALEIVNLGSEDCKKEIWIGADLYKPMSRRGLSSYCTNMLMCLLGHIKICPG